MVHPKFITRCFLTLTAFQFGLRIATVELVQPTLGPRNTAKERGGPGKQQQCQCHRSSRGSSYGAAQQHS